MRLCTVRAKDIDSFFGIELRKRILRIPAATAAYKLRPAQREKLADMGAYLRGLPSSEKLLRALLQSIAEDPAPLSGKAEDGAPFLFNEADIEWLPPVPNPGKILCVGLNYRDHCEEQNKPVPETPMIFNKFATSLSGHKAPLPLPLKIDPKLDYEAELAVVIGKRAKNVRKGSALGYVAGYMAMNDATARGLQASEKQWARAKGFDGSAPCGPYLVTADEIPDPHALSVKCRVNGEVRQNSNTKHLVFGIEKLIAHITEMITLEPGDIISTGTPGGVGVYREPQVFLKPGDKVEIEIEKIGTLENVCAKA